MHDNEYLIHFLYYIKYDLLSMVTVYTNFNVPYKVNAKYYKLSSEISALLNLIAIPFDI
jgi:hypothetical protein